mmetsp:Transcript_15119/g.23008  ORF Transcript_15119/g.23008 Transcript_15119/m.23008 type:complete len:160 (+) Transcript_15119:817-1296(+)
MRKYLANPQKPILNASVKTPRKKTGGKRIPPTKYTPDITASKKPVNSNNLCCNITPHTIIEKHDTPIATTSTSNKLDESEKGKNAMIQTYSVYIAHTSVSLSRGVFQSAPKLSSYCSLNNNQDIAEIAKIATKGPTASDEYHKTRYIAIAMGTELDVAS